MWQFYIRSFIMDFMKKTRTRSKVGKRQKNLYLSLQARQLLTTLSEQMGISETAVIELLVREKAQKENIAGTRAASV